MGRLKDICVDILELGLAGFVILIILLLGIVLLPIGFINLFRYYFYNFEIIDFFKTLEKDLNFKTQHFKIIKPMVDNIRLELNEVSFEISNNNIYFSPSWKAYEKRAFFVEANVSEEEFKFYLDKFREINNILEKQPCWTSTVEYKEGKLKVSTSFLFILLISSVCMVADFLPQALLDQMFSE